MIATISPSSSNVEHSLNTLRYAYRVKEIRTEGGDGEDVDVGYEAPHGRSPSYRPITAAQFLAAQRAGAAVPAGPRDDFEAPETKAAAAASAAARRYGAASGAAGALPSHSGVATDEDEWGGGAYDESVEVEDADEEGDDADALNRGRSPPPAFAAARPQPAPSAFTPADAAAGRVQSRVGAMRPPQSRLSVAPSAASRGGVPPARPSISSGPTPRASAAAAVAAAPPTAPGTAPREGVDMQIRRRVPTSVPVAAQPAPGGGLPRPARAVAVAGDGAAPTAGDARPSYRGRVAAAAMSSEETRDGAGPSSATTGIPKYAAAAPRVGPSLPSAAGAGAAPGTASRLPRGGNPAGAHAGIMPPSRLPPPHGQAAAAGGASASASAPSYAADAPPVVTFGSAALHGGGASDAEDGFPSEVEDDVAAAEAERATPQQSRQPPPPPLAVYLTQDALRSPPRPTSSSTPARRAAAAASGAGAETTAPSASAPELSPPRSPLLVRGSAQPFGSPDAPPSAARSYVSASAFFSPERLSIMPPPRLPRDLVGASSTDDGGDDYVRRYARYPSSIGDQCDENDAGAADGAYDGRGPAGVDERAATSTADDRDESRGGEYDVDDDVGSRQPLPEAAPSGDSDGGHHDARATAAEHMRAAAAALTGVPLLSSESHLLSVHREAVAEMTALLRDEAALLDGRGGTGGSPAKGDLAASRRGGPLSRGDMARYCTVLEDTISRKLLLISDLMRLLEEYKATHGAEVGLVPARWE